MAYWGQPLYWWLRQNGVPADGTWTDDDIKAFERARHDWRLENELRAEQFLAAHQYWMQGNAFRAEDV